MQQGMLFHSLYTPQSGLYIQQLICALHEELNVPAFRQAWQRVAERHPILRTSFRLERLDVPLQDVHRYVSIPFEQPDWRGLSHPEREQQLNAYLQTDRRRGFDPVQAPLMRIALFRLAEADYKLVWTSHHALLDGRSRLILAKEVFGFYEAFCRHETLDLPQPRPYRDFIEWRETQDIRKQESFWRDKLKGFSAPTSMGVGCANSVAEGQEGSHEHQTVRFSSSFTESLRTFARHNDITINTLLQGAWGLLLSRYSGQEDVVFGVTSAARHRDATGTENMVGLFINTLPMRTRVHGNILIVEWLKELRNQWLEQRNYEHTPLVDIQKWSDIPVGEPLFESVVVFENYRLNEALRHQGGFWRNREFELLGTTNYPVMLSGAIDKSLLLEIAYDRDRFDKLTIARMFGHLQTLLDGMVAYPERRLSELPLLTNAERHQLLVQCNDTEKDFPKNSCIHELFEAQVESTPDAIAVVFPSAESGSDKNSKLTYGELNLRANQFAHYLRKRGVGPDVLVGICVERSIELIVGLLGILKAGGAYVPLDPRYPKERLAFMLKDTQAPVLVTETKWLGVLPETIDPAASDPTIQNPKSKIANAIVVCLDRDWHEIAKESTERPERNVSAENLVYAIYTSGTTGTPKGALITHSNLVNAYLAWEEAYQLKSAAPVYLQMANFVFDVFSGDWVRALCCGGKLVLCPTEFLLDAPQLYDLMRREQVDCADFVPSVIRNLVNHLEVSGDTLDFMRLLIVGSEIWYVAEYQKLQRLCGPNTRLMNSYGVTEATIDSSFFCGDVHALAANRSVPIGRPFANTQLYIVDRHVQLAPVGMPGELCISGAGLARGYLNCDELTAERFMSNPFNDEPTSRLYKTGDLARYLPDGNIEFLGRMDNQIKIRGYRIELGEIEAILKKHPAIYDCVIVAREDFPTNQRLVAYVVTNSRLAPAVDELRRFLKTKLHEFMIPNVFVFTESLPLTPTGKLDRKALPMPDLNYRRSKDSYVAPRTNVENKLIEIWAAVLKTEHIGIHDDFFEIGGHSLLAMQVISRIREAFQIEITVRQLFETPNVEEMAEVIQTLELKRDGSPLPSITCAARDRYLIKLQE